MGIDMGKLGLDVEAGLLAEESVTLDAEFAHRGGVAPHRVQISRDEDGRPVAGHGVELRGIRVRVPHRGPETKPLQDGLVTVRASFHVCRDLVEDLLVTSGLADEEFSGCQCPLPDVDVLVPQPGHEDASVQVDTAHGLRGISGTLPGLRTDRDDAIGEQHIGGFASGPVNQVENAGVVKQQHDQMVPPTAVHVRLRTILRGIPRFHDCGVL